MMGSMKGLIYYENVAENRRRQGIISSGRPVVVVCDRPSGTAVQVVPLTTGNKNSPESIERYEHIPVSSLGRASVALCEQIRTVDYRELSRFPKGICTSPEIKSIEDALRRIFGI